MTWKLLLGGIVGGIILVGCAKDTNPEADLVEGPTAVEADAAGVSLGDAGEGYAIFQRKCTECHEARIPEDALSPGWHATVNGMSWNAGLDKTEEKFLLAYLQSEDPKR